MTLYSKQAKAWSPVRESDAGNVHCAIGYVAAADALIINQNDVCEMVKIPAGATIIDVILDIPNVGANVNVSVGDGDNTTYLISATTGAAALVIRKNGSNAGVPKTYAAEDTIDVVFTNANPTDNVAFTLFVMYVCGVDTTPY